MPMVLQGGTEVHTLLLIRVLIGLGYAVTVCCYYEYQDAMVSNFETAGAQVLLLKRRRNTSSRSTIRELISLLIDLRKTFSLLRPDALHVQYVAPGFIPIIAGRLAGIKKIFATVHTAGDTLDGPAAKYILRFSARLCSHFVCVSKSAGEHWFGKCEVFDPISRGQHKRHSAIYNGVDFLYIEKTIASANTKKLRKELGLNAVKTIGSVGRLVTLKGYAVLLRAFKEIVKEYSESALVIVGDGIERQSLELLASELGISPKICWLGEQPQKKVFELLAVMDIFAVPSFVEGFGLTAAEAMAAALPVVASNVEGLREVVEDGVSGKLVRPGNPSELAGAVLTLLRDPKECRRLGLVGRERVRELFSFDTFQKSYSTLYLMELGDSAGSKDNRMPDPL